MGATAEDLKQRLEEQRADISRDVEAIGDRVTPSRVVERRRARVKQSIGGVRSKLMGTAESMTTSAEETLGEARGLVAEAPRAVKEQTQGAPLLAGAVAFGVGALVAAITPTTRREEQLVRDHEDELSQATDAVRSEVRDVAQQAASDLTPHAQEAAGGLADSARARVEEVTTSAKEAGGGAR